MIIKKMESCSSGVSESTSISTSRSNNCTLIKSSFATSGTTYAKAASLNKQSSSSIVPTTSLSPNLSSSATPPNSSSNSASNNNNNTANRVSAPTKNPAPVHHHPASNKNPVKHYQNHHHHHYHNNNNTVNKVQKSNNSNTATAPAVNLPIEAKDNNNIKIMEKKGEGSGEGGEEEEDDDKDFETVVSRRHHNHHNHNHQHQHQHQHNHNNCNNNNNNSKFQCSGVAGDKSHTNNTHRLLPHHCRHKHFREFRNRHHFPPRNNFGRRRMEPNKEGNNNSNSNSTNNTNVNSNTSTETNANNNMVVGKGASSTNCAMEKAAVVVANGNGNGSISDSSSSNLSTSTSSVSDEILNGQSSSLALNNNIESIDTNSTTTTNNNIIIITTTTNTISATTPTASGSSETVSTLDSKNKDKEEVEEDENSNNKQNNNKAFIEAPLPKVNPWRVNPNAALLIAKKYNSNNLHPHPPPLPPPIVKIPPSSALLPVKNTSMNRIIKAKDSSFLKESGDKTWVRACSSSSVVSVINKSINGEDWPSLNEITIQAKALSLDAKNEEPERETKSTSTSTGDELQSAVSSSSAHSGNALLHDDNQVGNLGNEKIMHEGLHVLNGIVAENNKNDQNSETNIKMNGEYRDRVLNNAWTATANTSLDLAIPPPELVSSAKSLSSSTDGNGNFSSDEASKAENDNDWITRKKNKKTSKQKWVPLVIPAEPTPIKRRPKRDNRERDRDRDRERERERDRERASFNDNNQQNKIRPIYNGQGSSSYSRGSSRSSPRGRGSRGIGRHRSRLDRINANGGNDNFAVANNRRDKHHLHGTPESVGSGSSNNSGHSNEDFKDFPPDYTTLTPILAPPVTEFIMPYVTNAYFTTAHYALPATITLTEYSTNYVPHYSETVLLQMVKKQIEYYFSEENLSKDFFLRRKMDSEGYLPIKLIASFHRVNNMTQDPKKVLGAIMGSNKLELNKDKTSVRTKVNPKSWPIMDFMPVNSQSSNFIQQSSLLSTHHENDDLQLASRHFYGENGGEMLNPNVPEFVPKSNVSCSSTPLTSPSSASSASSSSSNHSASNEEK